jgi:hypothetical protein
MALPAFAASPEETYFAARDAAIQKIQALEDAKKGEDATKEQDRGFADLTQQMRKIMGPIAIKGMPAEGALNLSTLYTGDEGYGMLDGLAFTSADEKTRVIVTTESIFNTWLKSHKDWWGDKVANVPQDMKEALVTDAFYTQAIQTDAAVMQFTKLPLRAPAKTTFLFAMLAARSQDASPAAPDEIFVTLVQGGRVFVANTPLEKKFAAVPACDQVRQAQEKKADAMYERYEATERKDEKLFDQYTAAREEADTLFLRCYADAGLKQAAFAPAVKQAQAFLDTLPLR